MSFVSEVSIRVVAEVRDIKLGFVGLAECVSLIRPSGGEQGTFWHHIERYVGQTFEDHGRSGCDGIVAKFAITMHTQIFKNFIFF
jgi:hypothetical protein